MANQSRNAQKMTEDVTLSFKDRSFGIIASFINTLWKIFAFVLISIAIVIASARLFSNEFSRFKPEIEAYLSQQLDREVSIKSLKLEWPAKGPRIKIKDLRIADDQSQTINSLFITNGDVAINLWESLFYLDWITEGIDFQGIQAIVNPEISVDESNQQQTGSTTQLKPDALNQWLLRQATIEIYDSYLLLVTKDQPKLSYALPVLTYHGGEKRRQLKAYALTSSGSELDIKAEIIGQKLSQNQVIDLYISAQKINLEEIPNAILKGNLSQFSGSLNFETWSQWRQNKLDNVIAKVSVNEVSNNHSDDKISISPFHLIFQRELEDDWAFATSPLKVKVNNKPLQPFQLEGRNEILENSGDEKWNFTGLNIPISIVGSLSKSYLPENLQTWLTQSNPSGKIDNLEASIVIPNPQDEDVSTQFELSFDLIKFHSERWENIPGMSNIDAKVNINQTGLEVELDSKLGELDLATTFRYPLQFDQLQGKISIQQQTDGNQLIWDNFIFNSEEIKINSTGKMDFLENGAGYLEIVATLKDGDTSLTPWFLPVTVMSKNLVKYLDESVHEGALTHATAIARGPFSSFPFENMEGVFDIRANISGVTFQFQPDWSPIKNLSAELRFFGDQMAITAYKGSLDGVQVKRATAEIQKLSDKNSSLLINAVAVSQDQAAIKLLTNSPFKAVADSLQILEFGGELKTSLKMDIPMKRGDRPKIEGKVKFNKSSILLKTPHVPFQKVQGYLNFNQNGLSNSELNGSLWDQKFSFKINSNNSLEQSQYFATFKSKLSNLGISNLSGFDSKIISEGTTKIEGKLGLSTNSKTNQSRMTLKFSSDLDGIKINIPGIIEKETQQKYPLSVNLNIQNNDVKIDANLNQELRLKALHNNQKWKGAIQFGVDQKVNPISIPTEYIWTSQISSQQFDLVRWIELTDRFISSRETIQSTELKIPFHLGLETKNFTVAGFEFGPTVVTIDQSDNFSALIKADNLDAVISYQEDSSKPLSILFNKLQLDAAVELSKAKDDIKLTEESDLEQLQDITLKQLQKILPSEFPHTFIKCSSCSYGSQQLGSIELETIPAGNNLAIEGKWYQQNVFETNFTAQWNQLGTQVAGQLTSKDVEGFSQYWDVATGIKKSALLTNFSLQWTGAPWDFNAKSLNGKISSILTQGHIDEVSAKGAQVFSFLSLQNLKRRLTLDFNDVFAKGFFYDKISATFLIKQGLAYSNTVNINGTAADIEITGYTDLINREFNQHMVVTPKLSSSLPVLAGWAISPTTALVALFLDKILLKPALDVVTRIDYKISGPWEKPEIIEVGKQQKEFKVDKSQSEPESSSPEKAKTKKIP